MGFHFAKLYLESDAHMGVVLGILWMIEEWCLILFYNGSAGRDANRAAHCLAKEATKYVMNRTLWDQTSGCIAIN
jgi:hypothetical protein